jgi:hypothetical protein
VVAVTTTRYPGNPDFHEVPPRCADCGRFCGGWESSAPVVWERNEGWDLQDWHTARCLDCATDRVMERHDIDTREEARHAVLGAISG